MAGRKGNRSKQPTCALLSHNCFTLVISHCLTAAPQLLQYCWWKGWARAISETNAVYSQNRSKMGRSNPSFSHLLSCSSPLKQADYALGKSAGGSFSQAVWYIVLMTLWVQVHKKRLNSLSSSTSKASYQTSSWHWQLSVITDWRGGGWKKWPRGKDFCIFDRLCSFPLKQ